MVRIDFGGVLVDWDDEGWAPGPEPDVGESVQADLVTALNALEPVEAHPNADYSTDPLPALRDVADRWGGTIVAAELPPGEPPEPHPDGRPTIY